MTNPQRRLDRDRARLTAWIGEWELDRRLAGNQSGGTAHPRRPVAYPAANARTRLSIGQIRLLPPVSPETAERPVYVAILDARDKTQWIVAPFGRFATPALPGELATRRRTPMLRVLCVWNLGIVSGDLLRSSYPAGRLTAAELRLASAVHSALAAGIPPAVPPGRIGPPLAHPLDPRHLYIEEERALWIAFDRPGADGGAWGDALQRAAEKKAGYRTRGGETT